MNDVGRDRNKADVLEMLQEGMESLSEALRGIDASLAKRRPQAGAWSVVECVEHLTLTERALLERLKQATPCDESREDRAREAKFQDLALNRARRIEAPEPVRPAIGSTSLDEAVEEFRAARRETIEFVDDFRGDLRWRVAQRRAGMRDEAIADVLLASPEFRTAHGAIGNAALVDLVYRNALGRSPTPGVRNIWSSHLASGTLSRGAFVRSISESRESIATNAAWSQIIVAYRGMVGVSPSSTDLAWWKAKVAAGSDLVPLLARLYAGATYGRRFS